MVVVQSDADIVGNDVDVSQEDTARAGVAIGVVPSGEGVRDRGPGGAEDRRVRDVAAITPEAEAVAGFRAGPGFLDKGLVEPDDPAAAADGRDFFGFPLRLA